jgi:hypothetical protein
VPELINPHEDAMIWTKTDHFFWWRNPPAETPVAVLLEVARDASFQDIVERRIMPCSPSCAQGVYLRMPSEGRFYWRVTFDDGSPRTSATRTFRAGDADAKLLSPAATIPYSEPTIFTIESALGTRCEDWFLLVSGSPAPNVESGRVVFHQPPPAGGDPLRFGPDCTARATLPAGKQYWRAYRSCELSPCRNGNGGTGNGWIYSRQGEFTSEFQLHHAQPAEGVKVKEGSPAVVELPPMREPTSAFFAFDTDLDPQGGVMLVPATRTGPLRYEAAIPGIASTGGPLYWWFTTQLNYPNYPSYDASTGGLKQLRSAPIAFALERLPVDRIPTLFTVVKSVVPKNAPRGTAIVGGVVEAGLVDGTANAEDRLPYRVCAHGTSRICVAKTLVANQISFWRVRLRGAWLGHRPPRWLKISWWVDGKLVKSRGLRLRSPRRG